MTTPTAPNYHNKTWLTDEYITKNRTMTEIGTDCAVSPMTIQNWLDRLAIPTRPRGRRGSTQLPRIRDKMVSVPKASYESMSAEIAALKEKLANIKFE
tara:strand:+ start:1342 stop:1635 length:294 start_codon:yes stop_codon:yes gene_type:complete